MARQRFSAEFKREAVRLLEQGDKPVTQLALELGIARNLLYKWRDALASEGEHAFRGPARRTPQQQELAQLRRDRARLQQENTILKKRRRTSPTPQSAVRLQAGMVSGTIPENRQKWRDHGSEIGHLHL